MTVFEYDARILPQITLIGQDQSLVEHRNIRRISEDCIYYIVTDGELFFCEDGTEYHLRRGDCFLFEPHKPHYGTADSFYNLAFIHFKHPNIIKTDIGERALSGYTSQGRIILPKLIHIEDTAGFNNILSSVQKAIERSYITLDNYDILCSCSVHEAFISINRLCTENGTRRNCSGLQLVNGTISYLNANYRQKLTGSIIEKEMSYNFDYLNQLFRRYLDSTIFQTLESIRIGNAENLILTSELSMESVAAEVGYNDETYFSRVFKKHYGLSPLQYKQSFNKTRL